MEQLFVIPILALASVVGFVVLAYGGRAFFVILNTAAAGSERVEWSDEPITDWVFQGVYLAMMVMLWAAPAYLLGSLAGGGVAALVLSVVSMAFLFPVGILSALTGPSRWQPLSTTFLLRAKQRPADAVGFYLRAAPLLTVCVLSVAAVFGQLGAAVSLAAAGGLLFGLCGLLFARVAGRYALLLTFTKDPYPEPEEPDEDEPAARPKRPRPAPAPAAASDPWAAPPEPSPEDLPVIAPDGEEVGGYGVTATAAPKPPAHVPTADPREALEGLRQNNDDEDDGDSPRPRRKKKKKKRRDDRGPVEPVPPWRDLWGPLARVGPLVRVTTIVLGTGFLGLCVGLVRSLSAA